MGMWDIFRRLFSGNKIEEETPLTPEMIESLPMADDPVFHRDSKRLLQRFDEYITAAEAESEILSIELDNILNQEDILRAQLKHLNKPNSWHERHILFKIDRLNLHSNNLKQRIEIYSQNIKLYLNLIAKIQDVKAMRLNGLDQDKIQTIWLEFTDTLNEYKDRLNSEEAGFDYEKVTTAKQEERIAELRKELIPVEEEKEEIPSKPKIEETEETPLRPPLSELLSKRDTEGEFEDLEDDSQELALE